MLPNMSADCKVTERVEEGITYQLQVLDADAGKDSGISREVKMRSDEQKINNNCALGEKRKTYRNFSYSYLQLTKVRYLSTLL